MLYYPSNGCLHEVKNNSKFQASSFKSVCVHFKRGRRLQEVLLYYLYFPPSFAFICLFNLYLTLPPISKSPVLTRKKIVLGELLQETVGKLQNHQEVSPLEKRFHCGINVPRVVVDAMVRGGRQKRVAN